MKKKLHVLFLCGWYPSEVLPTNGDFIQRHAEAVSLQHKVSVLHIISRKEVAANTGITFKKINGIFTYVGYVNPSKNPLIKAFRFWRTYQKIVRKIGEFDLVHLNEIYPFGIFALHIKKIKKVPYIISEHWSDYKYPFSQKISFFKKMISKMISKNASFICPVSDDLKNSMQKFGLKANYKTIPNVVDTELFKPHEKNGKEFTIVHVSNFIDVYKNISGMLRVAKKLEEKIGDFTWKFIGGTSIAFSDLIKNLNFRSAKIEFINHIPQQSLVKELQSSNVFVLFSNYENLPCVILESFSCGTPVISTDVGGISECFPSDFGKLITVKNEYQLEEEILNFYNGKYNLESKENMHTYINLNFSKKIICEKFTELYHNTLNN